MTRQMSKYCGKFHTLAGDLSRHELTHRGGGGLDGLYQNNIEMY